LRVSGKDQEILIINPQDSESTQVHQVNENQFPPNKEINQEVVNSSLYWSNVDSLVQIFSRISQSQHSPIVAVTVILVGGKASVILPA